MRVASRFLLLSCLAVFAVAGCKKEGAEGAAPDATPTPTAGAATAGGDPLAPGADGLPGFGAPTPGPPFDPQKLPLVVARVNGQEISRADVLDRVAAFRAQVAQAGAPEPPRDEAFYREMVDQLIGAHLLYGEAQRLNMVPSEEQARAQLAQIRSRFPSEEEYKKQLQAQGVDEAELTTDLARSVAVGRITEQLRSGVQVSEEEMRAFYQENLERMKRPEQLRVRHILVGIPRQATEEQKKTARAEADDVLRQVKAGGDFAALAVQHSDDPGSRAEGGLLPWMARGETVPAFDQAAGALQKGGTSEVVETPFGFHVLRLEDTRPSATVPFEEAREQIEQAIRRRKARDAVRQRVQELRAQAKVEVLF
jgi:parvulin-like peptidyl-prolyl isomerase